MPEISKIIGLEVDYRMRGKTKCPVCHGSGKMTWVIAGVDGKKMVKRTCTACRGERYIPFIDLRMTVENNEAEEDEGWGKREKWKKAHYFVYDVSLCEKTGPYQGQYLQDVDDELKCIDCQRKLARRAET